MTIDWSIVGRDWVSANLANSRPRIPVFDEDGLVVKVNRAAGRAAPVLCRHPLLDDELAAITDTVESGFRSGVEGMLYCLYVLNKGVPAPIYVGIAQAVGHSGGLSSLFKNRRKKPRFDDRDGHHIGDLSTQVIPGYAKRKAYKKAWADRMFSNAPSLKPRLRTRVYFWGKAWDAKDMSAVPSLGHTPPYLEEALLVCAFRCAYRNELLRPGGRLLCSETSCTARAAF